MKYKLLLYNEKEISERIYNNGFTNGEYNRKEAALLSKYMRHVLGYKDGKLKKRLIEFCQADKNFNLVLESNVIKDFVKNSKNPFIIREGVGITKKELEKAREIKDFKSQKIYIGLLTLAKKNKSNFVSTKNWTVLKRICNMNITGNQMYDSFHELFKANLIYPVIRRSDSGQRLLYMDWDGTPEIMIFNDSDFYKLGRTYENYCGGYLMYCEDCGVEFIRKGKTHKYCSTHAIEREKLRKR